MRAAASPQVGRTLTRQPDFPERTGVTPRPVRLVTPSTRYCQRRVNRVQRTPRWKGLALIALALSSTGCFRYVPAQIETIPPGQAVRVLMTRQGAAELAEISEVAAAAPIVDGTVVSVEGEELLLRVPVGRRQDGFVSANLDQTIRVPTGEIVSFQRREFDPLASVLVVGGAAGLVAVLVSAIVTARKGEEPDPDGPEDLRLHLSLFSFSIGR